MYIYTAIYIRTETNAIVLIYEYLLLILVDRYHDTVYQILITLYFSGGELLHAVKVPLADRKLASG